MIAVHEAPAASHRCHWYPYDVGLPSQEPFDAVSDAPTWGVPLTTGGVTLLGATGADGAEPVERRTRPDVADNVTDVTDEPSGIR